ncbi:hypothetical protein Q8A64_09260 [Oxalobacteraceae bacterium R-40]|uniref:Uncharacterized protein n=1 Tax=Keguizhuia sedimenti TaxID=3064264 RepID=A0ABU1BNK9_9BURK|nr:hypothetical protein [Oxalobacteraceae bacterium R-40]
MPLFNPWPYALAFTTAHVLECGTQDLANARLNCIASISIIAESGLGIDEKEIGSLDILPDILAAEEMQFCADFMV